MRWPRRSSAWRVKPTTLIASTGNTQGIRLRSRPPSSAPSSAATSVIDAVAGAAGAPVAGFRRRRAAPPATPATGSRQRRRRRPQATGRSPWLRRASPGLPSASTTGITAGLAARWADSGTRGGPGVALPGLRPLARRSRSLRRFPGRTPASCRAAAAGRPATLTLSALPSTCDLAVGWRAASGCASNAASNAAPLAARWCSCTGILSENSPSSGMHSLRQTSHAAFSLTSRSPRQQRRLEVGRDRERHRQQHRALVAVVGEIADRDLLGHRPGDVAGRHARRQGPLQLRRQAGVAGVLPVGVPLGLVRRAAGRPRPACRARRRRAHARSVRPARARW